MRKVATCLACGRDFVLLGGRWLPGHSLRPTTQRKISGYTGHAVPEPCPADKGWVLAT